MSNSEIVDLAIAIAIGSSPLIVVHFVAMWQRKRQLDKWHDLVREDLNRRIREIENTLDAMGQRR